MSKVGLSVVVVSWNTKDITDECLRCLRVAVKQAEHLANIEVLVVENASDDGTPLMITKKHPWVKLFNSGSDLGYAKGNNYGVKRINKKNEYLLLINNDAYVKADTLVNAINYFKSHSQCDVLGCELNYLDGRFQPSAGFLPTPKSVWGWIWGLDRLPILKNFFAPVHPKDPEFFTSDKKLGWVMGAFLFMKTRVFLETGGFDENFFMYMEEVEWCKRINDLGYQIWYTPTFKITHVDKASAFNDPVNLAKIFQKEILGLIYFLKKHYPKQRSWLIPIVKIGIFVRLVVFAVLGNDMRVNAYKSILSKI